MRERKQTAAFYLRARRYARWSDDAHVLRALMWMRSTEPAENGRIDEGIVMHHQKLGAANWQRRERERRTCLSELRCEN